MSDALAFCVDEHEHPAIEVRVNFGVFAGRNATQAEIEDLARLLRGEIEPFAVIAEERHEFGDDRETALRQIVIEVSREYAGADPSALCSRMVALAETWATACIQTRSELGELGSEI
jgi:hypothetical protein